MKNVREARKKINYVFFKRTDIVDLHGGQWQCPAPWSGLRNVVKEMVVVYYDEKRRGTEGGV